MTRLPLLLSSLTALTAALPARAEVPQVIADIAPVHSLVAQVMDGLGTPDLLIEPGADAHHMTLRPTVARQLDAANLVVQVGPELTPWLVEPLSSLASDAQVLTLLETEGWTPRMFAEDEHHDDHDADHGHDHDEEEASAHDHSGLDPHAWLDPRVAIVWIGAIRDALNEADPENAGIYTQNADDAATRLAALDSEIAQALPDTARGTWLAPHDAMGYFEDRFDVASAGSVADSEAAAPGPAHLGELRAMVEDGTVTCVLTEANSNENRARTLIEGTSAKTAFLNATGTGLTPGPDLYAELMQQIATTLAECTAP